MGYFAGSHSCSVITSYFDVSGAIGSSTVVTAFEHDFGRFETGFEIRSYRSYKYNENIFFSRSNSHLRSDTDQQGTDI